MTDVILKRFEQPDETRVLSKGRFEIVRIADTATLSMSATEITAGGIPAQKFYYPNGAADGFTIYLRSRYNDGLTRFRVVGLPLSPTPQVFEDW